MPVCSGGTVKLTLSMKKSQNGVGIAWLLVTDVIPFSGSEIVSAPQNGIAFVTLAPCGEATV
jgi:hypothetical protein